MIFSISLCLLQESFCKLQYPLCRLLYGKCLYLSSSYSCQYLLSIHCEECLQIHHNENCNLLTMRTNKRYLFVDMHNFWIIIFISYLYGLSISSFHVVLYSSGFIVDFRSTSMKNMTALSVKSCTRGKDHISQITKLPCI